MPSELLADGFCINAIRPTHYQAIDCTTAEHHASYENNHTLQRAQYPAEIDGIVMYQLSALSDSVSGQNLPFNGGLVFN